MRNEAKRKMKKGTKEKETEGEKYWKREKGKKHRSKQQQTSKVVNIHAKHLHNIVVSLTLPL
jgi:hypothetical protein